MPGLTMAGLHAGLGITMAGIHSSAHYDLVPAAQVWASLSPDGERPVGLGGTVELQAATWRHRTRYTTYGNTFVRGSVLVDLAAGTRGTVVRLGAGPALAVRSASLVAGDLDVGGSFVEPGARLRTAIDAPLGPHLVFQWHLGATTRTSGLDYDTGLGLGWRP